MSTELTLAQETGQSLAEMMGLSGNAGSQTATLARMAQVQTPIMGVVNMNGKQLKTEVIGVGTYKLAMPDDTVVYAEQVEIRIFAMRQQWQRWHSESNKMQKTVMANSLNGDLKDNTGGFNLGRPSGYIKDFSALPEATKEIIRSVKRFKIFFGTVTLIEPKDENGDELEGDYTDIPFVMDVKNRDSMESLDDAVAALAKRNVLPIMYTLQLGSAVRTLPNGNNYATVVAMVGQKVGITEKDNETLRDFMDYIQYVNGYILGKWEEKNVEGIDEEDAAIIGQLVDVDGDDE
jgi:hypothetical protein